MCYIGVFNFDPIIPYDAYITATKVLRFWLFSAVIAIGLTTNCLNLIVFWKISFREPINITMVIMAACDLLKLLSALVLLMPWFINEVSEPTALSWHSCLLPQAVFIELTLSNVSCVMSGYLSIERCLCVAIPFKVKRILRPRFTLAVMASIFIIVVPSLIPMMLIFKCYKTYSFIFQTDIFCVQYTEFFYKHGETYIHVFNVLNVAYPLIDLVCMVISTILISRHFYTRVRRTSMTGGRFRMSERDKIVLMLVIIIILNILFIIPRLVHFTMTHLFKEYFYFKQEHTVFMIVMYAIYMGDYINACTHLPIFLIMSTRFRSTFKDIFCSCYKRHSPSRHRPDNALENATERPENSPASGIQTTHL